MIDCDDLSRGRDDPNEQINFVKAQINIHDARFEGLYYL
jgi:hypothetical protein